MKAEIIRLNLISPLYYTEKTGADPFAPPNEEGEFIFCFELEPSKALEFESDPADFPQTPVFSGKAASPGEGAGSASAGPAGREGKPALPAGRYLFSQVRDVAGRQEIAEMAAEIQQEGLWQRLKPGTRIYLRRLFEDDKGVTQLFRPYEDN
ncbi:MAG: hypothetical protein LBC62_01315 [Treponema sp.]|jgi:hypothetical protein|nr:hypothetical protein [Treponema sp.]